MSKLEVRNIKAVYHRNGIGGEGFSIIAFDARDGVDIPEWEPFLAFSFDPLDTEAGNEILEHCVGVVRMREMVEAYPDRLHDMMAWRGADEFWPMLKPLVKADLDAYYSSQDRRPPESDEPILAKE